MLEFYLSGGAANTNPALSLGGARSSQLVAGDTVAYLSGDSIAGVSLGASHGLTLHTGSTNNASVMLSCLNGVKRLIFTPYGVAAGTVLPDLSNVKLVTSSGVYHLAWSASYPLQSIETNVTFASLPAVDTTARLVTTRSPNGLFDNTTPDPDYNVVTDYRCVYLRNGGAASVDCAVFLDTLAQGSSIYLGLDPSGVGGVPATLANEAATPSGVVFSQPTDLLGGLPVTLGVGQQIAVWLRRMQHPFLPRAIMGDSLGLSAQVLP